MQTFKSLHFINFKSSCVGSKHSAGVQPAIQHQIPLIINFKNYWFKFQYNSGHSSTQKSRKGTVV